MPAVNCMKLHAEGSGRGADVSTSNQAKRAVLGDQGTATTAATA